MKKINQDFFDYEDVTLVPKFFGESSRSKIDVSLKMGNYTFKLPIVPANMQSVINIDIAENLAKNGYFYILHRFYKNSENEWIDDMVKVIKNFKEKKLITSISVGVKDVDKRLINELSRRSLTPDFITIDIAHGHSKLMYDMIRYIKNVGLVSYIIAGNISTSEAATDLIEWGADAIKVGIAPGSACLTYQKTSFGSRGIQASTIYQIRENNPNAFIIADGGIKQNGHISCALAMGANLVMVGGLFSKCTDSPNPTFTDENGNTYKEYYGSASAQQKGKNVNVEGTTLVQRVSENDFLTELKYMKEDLQSALSYNGNCKLSDFIGNVDFIVKK